MQLNDRIRNYCVLEALPSESIKTYREYLALAVLKYSFPEKFSNLRKAESPDLQDDKLGLAVEVTWGGSQVNELIYGESVKSWRAQTEKEKRECVRKIKQNGGKLTDISISFPVVTEEDDKNNVYRAFQSKVRKVAKYHETFSDVGLAILTDFPLFLTTHFKWGQWLATINTGFEFVALIHSFGIDLYCFDNEQYFVNRINNEDMDALNKLSRMAAEGIIKDNDPVWFS